MLFAIFRKDGSYEQDISFLGEGLDYYETQTEAELIATLLEKTYKEADAKGHPWYENKFYVESVSEEYINDKSCRLAAQRAYAEMCF